MNDILSPLLLSLEVGIAATVLVAVTGIPLAWFLAKRSFRGKKTIEILVTLPLVIPPSVLGYYLLLLFGNQGPVGKLLQALGINIIFTPAAAVLASAIVSLPLMVRTVKGAIDGVDRQVEEAFVALGANLYQVARHITLPLARHGIFAGTVLAFARGVGEFGATLMVAGNIPGKTQTMPLAIYSAVSAGNYALANGLVLIMTLTSFGVLWLVYKYIRI